MMYLRSLMTLAAFVLPATLFAQGDAYQIRYMSNLNVGDSVVNITNAGSVNGTSPAGDICVNVYAYDAREEIQACCSCYTTPNGLYNVSGRRDLLVNTLTGVRPTSLVVKLTATLPVGGTCNAGASGTLASGIRAWGTTLHATPTGGYSVTETPFASAPLSSSEYSKLTGQCSAIQTIGSGFGICNSCRVGGLAITKW